MQKSLFPQIVFYQPYLVQISSLIRSFLRSDYSEIAQISVRHGEWLRWNAFIIPYEHVVGSSGKDIRRSPATIYEGEGKSVLGILTNRDNNPRSLRTDKQVDALVCSLSSFVRGFGLFNGLLYEPISLLSGPNHLFDLFAELGCLTPNSY